MSLLQRARPRPSVRAILVAIALVALALPVAAQTASGDRVQVRSGNHPDFARLVLVYSDPRRWSVVPTDAGYRIDIAGTVDFDVARVFDLIPRDRIGAVTVGSGGSLEIDVVCDCHVDALELPGRGLVVDIRDGPAPPGNPFELLRSDVRPPPEAGLPPPVEVADIALASPRLTFGLSPTPQPQAFARPVARPATGDLQPELAVAPIGEAVPVAPAVPVGTEPAAQDGPEAVTEAEPLDGPVPGRPEQGQPGRNEPDRPGGASRPATANPATDMRAAVERPAPDTDIPAAGVAPPLRPGPSPTEAPVPSQALEEPVSVTGPAGGPGVGDAVAGSRSDTAPGADEARPGRWLAPPVAAETGRVPQPSGDAALRETAASVGLPVVPDVPVSRDIAELLPLRVAPAQPPVSAEELAAATAFADVLARQVGRGIAQGVVDAAVASAPSAGSPVEDVTSAEEDPPPPEPTLTPPDPLDQIEIATALDIATARERRLDLPAGAQAACRDAALFDAAAWIGDPASAPDLGARRSMVVGEFDRVDADALEAAVRYHLALGFGAEARQLLETFGTPPPLPPDRSEVLRAMSHIVDGEAGAATAVLADQLACRSRAAIWGALAVAALPPAANYSATAILSGFEDLPNELRRNLGPELANRFLQIGDMETVAALRRSVDRIDPPDDAATELAREPGALLDARVEAAEGRALDAEARLADVARLDGPLAPDAVAELIESQLTRGELPDDALVATAAALATELRGDARGARLRRAELLAYVARDDFDRARDELRRVAAGNELGADEIAVVADAYVAALTARASDRAFLGRLPPDVSALLDLGLTPGAARPAAERLVALGLPEAALPLVDGLVADDTARMIAARGWLRLGEPGAALARVAGLAGDEAERLRAEAYDALGDPGTAARVLDDLGDNNAALAAAWRAGDLARVARDPDAPRAAIADLARSEAPPVPESLAPLADHRDLIAEIARRRATIAAELTRPPSTPTP